MAMSKIINRKNVRDYYEIALEIGIDTTGGILDTRVAKGMEGIKTVSSAELEFFRSALKECNNTSKKVCFDERE